MTRAIRLISGALSMMVLATPAAFAATFCVGNAAMLATALNVADNNGQDDAVLLQSGVYTGNFIYNANVAETGSLTLRGGYNAACTASSGNPADSVLDGGNTGRAILLSGRDNANLIVDAVTVRNGLGQANGAGMEIDRWVNASVTGSVFTGNNTAAGLDGVAGLDIDRTMQVMVSGNLFSGNNGGKGGGLAVSDMVMASITHNRFMNNSSTMGGGGLDLSSADEFSGAMMLANNLFAGNSSLEDGGGVDVNLKSEPQGSTFQATNNTFFDNAAGAGADGGGMEIDLTSDASSASLHNNIFWANIAGRGNDLSIDNDDDQNGVASSVALEFNDFNQAFFFGFWSRLPVAIPASNFNAVDPLFVNPAAGDFSLSAASILIDAGDSAAAGAGTVDLAGGPRVQGLAIDLGALESAADSDGDGVTDALDNCTEIANPDQRDTNGDGFGNVCDADLNNDGEINALDLGILRTVFFTGDPDADFNGDGVVNATDLGVMKASFFGAPGPSGIAP